MHMDKDTLRTWIEQYVAAYGQEHSVKTEWGAPLTGFASAHDPLFAKLKDAVSKTHTLPEGLLPGAATVVAFFIPFGRAVVKSNRGGELASREWAIAYIETNALIGDLSGSAKAMIEAHGHSAATIPATHNFDPKLLMSDWSHRHAAFIAGLGTFGVNNMLITQKGCCGRIGSLVTSLRLEADERPGHESCLHKNGSKCLRCVDRCAGGALLEDSFDRWKCYEMCRRNEEHFKGIGRADVCGKCLAGLPCSWADPASLTGQKAAREGA